MGGAPWVGGVRAAEGGMAGWRRARREISSYRHRGEGRVDNPPAGLVTGATDPDSGKRMYEYHPLLDSQLVWAG